MATTRSAEKMIRKIARRNAVNAPRRAQMRTLLRKAEQAIHEGQDAPAALRRAESAAMRAAQKNIIHKKAASRKIARLARRLNLKTADTSKQN